MDIQCQIHSVWEFLIRHIGSLSKITLPNICADVKSHDFHPLTSQTSVRIIDAIIKEQITYPIHPVHPVKSRKMCIQNALQQYILEITNDGRDVIDFFRSTMHGHNPNARIHHQMEAAKQLRKLGLPTGEITVHPEPVEGHTEDEQPTDNSELNTQNSPVTDLDIINYEVASLIREETNDGYFIADFLARVMRGTAGKGSPVSDADRMRAALELMNRGLGRFGDSRNRRISNSQEELIHSGLSRYIRERTDNGLHAARFLLDVASGQEQSFSMHQRVVATRELVRRGWATNYDAITPGDIAAYNERQDALEPTEHDIRLQEWRENERAEREDEPHEDEAQLESGLFAHLTSAEISRCEAMSDKDRQEFIQRLRQHRASRQSAAPQPDLVPVIPAEAGIHTPDTLDDLNPTDQPETTTEPTEDHENTDRNTIIQEISAPSRTPHPAHPVRSQARIRSP